MIDILAHANRQHGEALFCGVSLVVRRSAPSRPTRGRPTWRVTPLYSCNSSELTESAARIGKTGLVQTISAPEHLSTRVDFARRPGKSDRLPAASVQFLLTGFCMADRYENLRARIAEALHDLEWRAMSHLQSAVVAALSDAVGATDDAPPPGQPLDECQTTTAACGAAMQASAEAMMTLAADLATFLAIVGSVEAGGQMLTLGKEVREVVHAAASAGESLSAAARDIAAIAAEIPRTSLRLPAKTGWPGLDDLGYRALRCSRDIVNQTCNHDLRWEVSEQGGSVSFLPFAAPLDGKASNVAHYHLLMVKGSRKNAMTNSDAIGILAGTTNHTQLSEQEQSTLNGDGRIVAALTCQTDADGDRLQPGESYVLFVAAVLTDAGKSQTDNRPSLLSAPSSAFRWKTPLPSPTPEPDPPALSAVLAGRTHLYDVWQPRPEAGQTRFFTRIYLAIRNVEIALAAIQFTDAGNRKLLAGIDNYVHQLVHAADLLDKLAHAVSRKKAANQLVSDNLVTTVSTAAASAEKAFQAALDVLRTAAHAQSAIALAGAATAFQYDWLVRRYQLLTGRSPVG